MENILLTVNIILALILVVLVLIQKSEGGALGIGISQDSFMFSRTAGNFLTKATGIVAALFQREKSGTGQKVTAAMQDGVLNLCRVKLRDQQRLASGPLEEYSQFGEGIPFIVHLCIAM